jgi:hypothetical protein
MNRRSSQFIRINGARFFLLPDSVAATASGWTAISVSAVSEAVDMGVRSWEKKVDFSE